jgi:hypothetical protein
MQCEVVMASFILKAVARFLVCVISLSAALTFGVVLLTFTRGVEFLSSHNFILVTWISGFFIILVSVIVVLPDALREYRKSK